MQALKFSKGMFLLLLGVMGAILGKAAYSLLGLHNFGFSDADGLFTFKFIFVTAFTVIWLFLIQECIEALLSLKKNSKNEPVITLGTAKLKGSGNGTFPKHTQRKYFIALCLMYPNLGGTLQEIQAVGLGQQPELSPNCKGYIQGFMQALIDARAWHFDSLVQMDAFVQQLLTDADVLKSFVKDFKNDIEEAIELTLNPSADHL